MYYTYMLRCGDHSIYTGMTTDYQRRFAEHTSKGQKCAKYTKTHTAVKLLAVWQSDSRSLACRLEARIKQLTKSQKEKLAAENDMSPLEQKLDITPYRRIDLTDGEMT